MADFARLVATLAEHMKADLSRTDVLRALIWPIAALLSAMTIGAIFHVAAALTIFLCVLLAIFIILYAAAYIYFMITDPSALRSEKYNIEKLAIEHGVYGDNQTGLIEEKPDAPLYKGASSSDLLKSGNDQ